MNRRGFSLVEILFALLILGAGIVISLNIFPLSWQSFAYSRKLHEVSMLAEKKLEELKSTQGLSAGQVSGKEEDLDWNIILRPVRLDQGIDVMHVELNIEFYFQGRPQNQKFITYF